MVDVGASRWRYGGNRRQLAALWLVVVNFMVDEGGELHDGSNGVGGMSLTVEKVKSVLDDVYVKIARGIVWAVDNTSRLAYHVKDRYGGSVMLGKR
ncbi:hypothetical protein L1987_58569 [Smallanthus sonchifolius]|uniref:Uncharacterized protein n=1 Tax=Smallanthus sonchifolius TaxID=185202 RepID=A0ACB9DFZ6_9ASTR|nr:hypothetical protein L1987_58569 [Smallanthus sonchifolius]